MVEIIWSQFYVVGEDFEPSFLISEEEFSSTLFYLWDKNNNFELKRGIGTSTMNL